MSSNKSLENLNLVWNEKRFTGSRSAYRAARRSVFRAKLVLLKSEVQSLENQNDEIRQEINRCYVDLQKYDDKIQTLDNMTELATQSLEVYFEKRMENLRSFVTEQCRVIIDGVQEEADHWKEIHAMLQQKLVSPGDLRSYGGGNGLPRVVKQSPEVSRIVEEDEPENDVSILVKSRSYTPLVTHSLKKARLLASKLSQDRSSSLKQSRLETSENVTTSEEISNDNCLNETSKVDTIADEVPTSSMAQMTLGDVSAIEKESESNEHVLTSDLSMSLLPPVTTLEPVVDHEKSMISTISDKTFVKSSVNGFSSSEEEDEDEEDYNDDQTVIEESYTAELKESNQPLLLTADRSIRRPPTIKDWNNLEKLHVKQERISSFPTRNVEQSPQRKTFLVNMNTFDTTTSSFARPTIVIEEETENLEAPLSFTESNGTQLVPITESEENKSSTTITTEIISKQRTTRRTTTRLLREVQQENIQAEPIHAEGPMKTRYATRYSTRLAATVQEENTGNRRRTTRLNHH